MDTLACNASKGILFLGKDCPSKDLIQRINRVDEAFCLIQGRIRVAVAELSRYCSITESSSFEEPSSSSSECQLGCAPEKTESLSLMIHAGILDDAVYASLKLLEDEACLTFRELKALEAEVDNACFPSSSSSEVPSSSSSEAPSSSSSEAPSSSSSEAPPVVCQIGNRSVIGFCPLVQFPDQLQGQALFDPSYGPCAWQSDIEEIPSDSSSESSSSSGFVDTFQYATTLYYNLALSRWELSVDYLTNGIPDSTELIAYLPTNNQGDPRGIYINAYPGCETYPFIVV